MRKLRKNEGFTLAELLIVVAIIAVLVAVSIPIFTSQLEKSREATDTANLRAAKAAAVTAYLDGSGAKYDLAVKGCYYSATQGVLTNTAENCGKGTATKGNADEANPLFDNGETNDYENTTNAKGKPIYVKVTAPTEAGVDATIDAHFEGA